MIINLMPPREKVNATDKERLDLLYEWARDTTEKLNLMLSGIGSDNLSAELKKIINGRF